MGKGRRRPTLSVVCCPTMMEYRNTVGLLNAREHVLEVAQEETRITGELADAVGRSGRVTAVGVVGGRRESARSLSRAQAGAAPAPLPESRISDAKVDTLWGALQVAGELSSSNSTAAPATRTPVTAVFLDLPSITGNDLLLDTVSAIRSLHAILQPSLGSKKLRVVAKSRALVQLQETLFHAAKVLENDSGAEAARLEAMLERGSPVVLATEGVDEYRRAGLRCLRAGDRVIEFGCHSGTTTRIAAEAVGMEGRVMGVDIGRSIIEHANRGEPANGHAPTSFQVGDAWDCGAVASMIAELGGRADVVLLDVGGVSGDSGLLEGLALVRQLYSLTRPRALVVKSSCIRQFAGQLQSSQRMFDLEPIRGYGTRRSSRTPWEG